MSILRVRDNEGNIIDIPCLKGDKGDPYTLTEEDKAEIVNEVKGYVDEALGVIENGSY